MLANSVREQEQPIEMEEMPGMQPPMSPEQMPPEQMPPQGMEAMTTPSILLVLPSNAPVLIRSHGRFRSSGANASS